MTAQELADIEACRSLILEFAARIDNFQTHTLGELLTPDASFVRPTAPDVVINGVDAILQDKLKAKKQDFWLISAVPNSKPLSHSTAPLRLCW